MQCRKILLCICIMKQIYTKFLKIGLLAYFQIIVYSGLKEDC